MLTVKSDNHVQIKTIFVKQDKVVMMRKKGKKNDQKNSMLPLKGNNELFSESE